MAFKNIFRKIDIFHIPTIVLFIGYCAYWLELYGLNNGSGCTSFFAWVCSIFFILFLLFFNCAGLKKLLDQCINEFRTMTKVQKLISVFVLVIVLFVFAVAIKAMTYPVHLLQEYDTLNYHITLPRQHLLFKTFKHIAWSHADLFINPLSYALAPYWLVAENPSKLIHIYFLLGVFTLPLKFFSQRILKEKFFSIVLVLAAILGTHALGIQISTAMLDVIMTYLFFAFLDSIYDKKYFMAALEFSFLFWAKPFFPLLFGLILLLLFIALYFRKSFVFSNTEIIKSLEQKRFLLPFIMFSVLFAGPFVVKSFLYTGSPIYPFFSDRLVPIFSEGASRKSLINSAKQHMLVKDAYGYGRGLVVFLKHVWLLAVPDKGVNNAYDYPAGLPILLLLPLFFFRFMSNIWKKKIDLLSLFVLLYWVLWWFGSQQTRFLFIPMILAYMLALGDERNDNNIPLAVCLIIGIMFTSLSVYRSNRHDFSKEVEDVIRAQDNEYIEMNLKYANKGEIVEVLPSKKDAAYACFPIFVKGPSYPWILEVSYDKKD